MASPYREQYRCLQDLGLLSFDAGTGGFGYVRFLSRGEPFRSVSESRLLSDSRFGNRILDEDGLDRRLDC
jgi:hypothetical protein